MQSLADSELSKKYQILKNDLDIKEKHIKKSLCELKNKEEKYNTKIKEIDKIIIKNKMLELDIKNLLKENKDLNEDNRLLRSRLEELQKWINKTEPKNFKNTKNKPPTDNDRVNTKLGSTLDGSSGLYERRENGRYGSLSSFDNYDDDYNEKYDSHQ